MRRLLVVVVVMGAAALWRDRLVDLLTRTTGTWVGSPERRR